MSMFGITYRGIHSSKVGLITKTKSRPTAPPVRITEETIPYRDGSLDYSEQGGRLFYDDKIVEIDFTAIEPSLSDTNELISKAVKWICGSWGDLIFDDMPDTVWRAKPIDLSEITYQMYRVGTFTVQFRCRPFNAAAFTSLPFRISDEIPIKTKAALNNGADNVYNISAIGDYTFLHYNLGDAAVRPKIYITGTADNGTHTIDIKINGRGFRLKFPTTSPLINGRTAVVDCEEFKVTCGNNDITEYLVNSDTAMSEFPEILPGENTVSISSQIVGQVKIEYYAQYFYGA